MARTHSDSRQQTFLPALEGARAERRALVRGALAGRRVRSRVAEELETLIMYLDDCDKEATGAGVGLGRLTEVLRRGKRTVQRRLAEARTLGFVTSWQDPRGRWRNRVQWTAIRRDACRPSGHEQTSGGDRAEPGPVDRVPPTPVSPCNVLTSVDPPRGHEQTPGGDRAEPGLVDRVPPTPVCPAPPAVDESPVSGPDPRDGHDSRQVRVREGRLVLVDTAGAAARPAAGGPAEGGAGPRQIGGGGRQIGVGGRQFGVGGRQIGAPNKGRVSLEVSLKDSLEVSSKKPPPPPVPNVAQGAPSHPTGAMTERASLADWREVEEVFCELGMGDAAGLVQLARGRGLFAGQILADVAWYRQHLSRFRGIGALHWRIRNATPGQPADDLRGWPQPTAEYQQAAATQAREARRAAAAAEEARVRRKLAAERAEQAALEARHGGRLDAMDGPALTALVERILADKPHLRNLARRPRDSPLLRDELLRLIERDAGNDQGQGSAWRANCEACRSAKPVFDHRTRAQVG